MMIIEKSLGREIVLAITVPDGVTADIDTVLEQAIRVTDAWVVKTSGAGGASDTIQVKNTATAITNAISINVADQVIVRATTLDDASHEIAAKGILRVTRTKVAAANVACIVYVAARYV